AVARSSQRSDGLRVAAFAVGGLMTAPLPQSASQPEARDPYPSGPLSAGMPAPDFALRTTPDQELALSAFRGRPVVLVFYPADWSPVCGDQLALYNELHEVWRSHRAQLLALSVDNTWSHLAYVKERRLHFPLLSDFEPKGEVARRYGVYDRVQGVGE